MELKATISLGIVEVGLWTLLRSGLLTVKLGFRVVRVLFVTERLGLRTESVRLATENEGSKILTVFFTTFKAGDVIDKLLWLTEKPGRKIARSLFVTPQAGFKNDKPCLVTAVVSLRVRLKVFLIRVRSLTELIRGVKETAWSVDTPEVVRFLMICPEASAFLRLAEICAPAA